MKIAAPHAGARRAADAARQGHGARRRDRATTATRGYVNQELEELQAVTAADVQRVLRKYVLDGKQVTIEYVQDTAAAKAKS